SRLTYLYPVKGNEQALGMDYRRVPGQWLAVKRMIDGGVPILIGPINLVQGGRGLIYRVPVSVRGRYWGLISTVIDADGFFSDTLGKAASENVDLAIRGKDGLGPRGEVMWGDASVFGRKDALRIDVDVPGGSWVVALRGRDPSAAGSELWRLHLLV